MQRSRCPHDNTLAHLLDDGIIFLKADGSKCCWNPAAAQLLGERISDPCLSLPALFNLQTLDLAQHAHARSALTLSHPTQAHRTLSLTVKQADTADFALIVRDVTETLRANQQTRDFVTNLSHELRTPLTVTKGYCELLEQYQHLPEEDYQRIIAQMKEHTERLESLVNDILTLAQFEQTQHTPLKPQHINMFNFLHDIQTHALRLSQGQHHISVAVHEHFDLCADEKALRMAVENMVFNAVKYTPAGGRIEIDWFEHEEQGVLRVKDNGPGIAAEHIPHLTERFYRVNRATRGTGLGLSIVKEALNAMDAQLDIHSVPEKGSSFSCVFKASALIPVTRDQKVLEPV